MTYRCLGRHRYFAAAVLSGSALACERYTEARDRGRVSVIFGGRVCTEYPGRRRLAVTVKFQYSVQNRWLTLFDVSSLTARGPADHHHTSL